LDLDAVRDGEWRRSRMGVLDGGGDRRRGRAVLGVNLGRAIVTMGLCDVALPKSLWAVLVTHASLAKSSDRLRESELPYSFPKINL